MGGIVSLQYSMATTHLITTSVLSEKCIAAYNNKIPVMKPEWVNAVWKDSAHSIIHATDSQYSKYEVPIFYKLVFCFSQIPAPQKNALKKIVEENGKDLLI